MNLSAVDIPRAGARQRAAEYRRAAKKLPPDKASEFVEIARAYDLAAKDDVALISLSKTIAAGGTMQRTLIDHGWRDGAKVETARRHFLLPRLAVCAGDASFVYTLGVRAEGRVEFSRRINPSENWSPGIIDVDAGFEIPGGITAAGRIACRWRTSAWSSMVPICPPEHRPPRARTLASYLILWEVESWEWAEVPPPPGDPALLKHVGGDIYAVLATWDLTELEQLVLTGRRPE